MLFQHCIRYLPHKRCTLALGQPSTGNFFMQCWLRQKQSSEVCCKKRCSQKFYKSFTGMRPVTLSKKRLRWHRCFPVSFAIFLRVPFFQNTSGRLLLPRQIQTKLYIIFSVKSCLRTVDQHYKDKFLVQFWPREIKTTLYPVIFLQKNDYKQKHQFADVFQKRCC